MNTERLFLSSALSFGLLAASCTTVEPDPEPVPGGGVCAWLDVSFQSDDEEFLLQNGAALQLLIDPELPMVDSNGEVIPAGPVGDGALVFTNLDPSDETLELQLNVSLGGDEFPTIAVDLGENVPGVYTLSAQVVDTGEVVQARTAESVVVDVTDCGVFSAEVAGLNIIEEPKTTTCDDGIDNDGDGWTDLGDPGCDGSLEGDEDDGLAGGECNDGLDNDSDGAVDAEDSDCESAFDSAEGLPSDPACDDDMDNDGDGWVDLDDPGCGGDPMGDSEQSFSSLACSDGNDNDGDGLVDSEDPDCEDGYDNDEFGSSGDDDDSAQPGDDDDSAQPGDDDDSAQPGDDDDSALPGDDDDSAQPGDDDDSALPGDDDDSALPGDDDDSASGVPALTWTEVYGIVQGCGCHSGATHSTGFAFAGDSMTAYGVLVDVPAFETATTSGIDRVEPGSSEDSYFMHKLDGTHVAGLLSDGVTAVAGIGSQMPLSGTPLSQEQRDGIRAWIDAGAPNN